MATQIFDNLDQVHAWIRQSVLDFGFHLDDNGQSLGETCAGDVADGIRLRAITEKRGAYVQWDDNEEKYAEWKEKKYGIPVGFPNFRTDVSPGSMLSPESLQGTRTVSQHEVVMLYGMGLPPTTSRTGYTNNDDTKRTDREKAGYAVTAGRPFYELDDHFTNAPVYQRIAERLHRWLDERNQAP